MKARTQTYFTIAAAVFLAVTMGVVGCYKVVAENDPVGLWVFIVGTGGVSAAFILIETIRDNVAGAIMDKYEIKDLRTGAVEHSFWATCYEDAKRRAMEWGRYATWYEFCFDYEIEMV